MSAGAPLLEVRGLRGRYGPVGVPHGLDLEGAAGALGALAGANGAGKTTLLHLLSGLLRPSGGTIRFDGQDLGRLPPHRIVAAGLCQVPEGRQVFAPLSVADNLRLGGYALRHDPAWLAAQERRIYELFPILAERRHQLAGTLSGGQQQMLALGRALLGRPRLLLLDEPSMGLAPLLVAEIFRVIGELNRQGVTILLVEQNARAALGIAHRGYVLETGRVVAAAPAATLLADAGIQRAYLGY